MTKPTKHSWMGDLPPGQSRTVADTPANRMAVSYWRRRAGIELRTRSLPGGEMAVVHVADTTVNLPVSLLTPRACRVLAEEFHAQEEDGLAKFFADLYVDLMGETLSLEPGG